MYFLLKSAFVCLLVKSVGLVSALDGALLSDMAGEGVAGVGNPNMPAPGDAKAEIQ